ncbi:hypothetical protein WN55_01965 [Dufourea novaeangliae]|uniref:Uncharacterized protein n=1 Tax=Dufourea novaeangliae TaxID=178035 RepID=A0A154PGT4_DUFNO|nr:hypothetical protein WN55_01965 [Dufourea novaeangliae]
MDTSIIEMANHSSCVELKRYSVSLQEHVQVNHTIVKNVHDVQFTTEKNFEFSSMIEPRTQKTLQNRFFAIEDTVLLV